VRFAPRRLAAAVLFLSASPALSADIPPLGPHTPMLVSYRILNQQDAVPANFSVLFAPDARAARIIFEGEPGYMLVDTAAHQLTVVMDQPNISFAIPTPKMFAPYFEWRDTVAFTRGPPGFAAGRPCNYWIAQTGRGQGQICFTNDGVPLRIQAESKKAGQTDIEAVSIQPEPYDPAQFEVPADHPTLEMKGLNLSPFGGLKGF